MPPKKRKKNKTVQYGNKDALMDNPRYSLIFNVKYIVLPQIQYNVYKQITSTVIFVVLHLYLQVCTLNYKYIFRHLWG